MAHAHLIKTNAHLIKGMATRCRRRRRDHRRLGTAAGALLALALNSTALGIIFGTFALVMEIREIVQLARSGAVTSQPH